MNSKLRQELDYFLSGLSFYTRIPCPSSVVYRPENLNKSRKYLPLIGLVVGLFAAFVFMISDALLPHSVSVLLSMIATIYLTGAFHEDGFADSCDGFGGGWEKAQILRIMKDSRVGTYGVVALLMILAVKFFTLLELAGHAIDALLFALVCGHSLSRLMASWVMQRYHYVSETETSKSQNVTSVRLSHRDMWLSMLPVIALLLAIWRVDFVVAAGFMWLASFMMGQYFLKKIGGYTGDCLGAVQQVTEVVFYLSVLAYIGE